LWEIELRTDPFVPWNLSRAWLTRLYEGTEASACPRCPGSSPTDRLRANSVTQRTREACAWMSDLLASCWRPVQRSLDYVALSPAPSFGWTKGLTRHDPGIVLLSPAACVSEGGVHSRSGGPSEPDPAPRAPSTSGSSRAKRTGPGRTSPWRSACEPERQPSAGLDSERWRGAQSVWREQDDLQTRHQLAGAGRHCHRSAEQHPRDRVPAEVTVEADPRRSVKVTGPSVPRVGRAQGEGTST
jgi:hypothetical protein